MNKHCGFVAIIGRPNVGKSTLLNRILGQKISITSRRPQTTRHRIYGIKTKEQFQVIYVDTPGLHMDAKRAMNHYMNQTANQSLHDVDVILFITEGTRWTAEDDWIAKRLASASAPKVLVVNKVDLVQDKARLLPHISTVMGKIHCDSVIPLSARSGENLDELEKLVEKYMPESEYFFPEEQITDKTERFLAAELIREKLTRQLNQEVPFFLTVEIEQFVTEAKITNISAVIWVEREGQKAIVIGEKGKVLKQIGMQARMAMEQLFGQKVYLQLWVRIKSGWSNDIRALHSLGYREDT